MINVLVTIILVIRNEKLNNMVSLNTVVKPVVNT